MHNNKKNRLELSGGLLPSDAGNIIENGNKMVVPTGFEPVLPA